MVCILTGNKRLSPPYSTFVHWTAGATVTDKNNYYNGKGDCESNAYDYVRPATQTQSLRMTVIRNTTVTMFNNQAQSELNT